MDRIFAR
ncbi:hypothetical protein SCAR479_09281 [Seiridium cardinale]